MRLGAWNFVLTIAAGSCSFAGTLLAITLLFAGAADGFAAGFADGVAGAADGVAGAADGVAGAADGLTGAADGFGACLLFNLTRFSVGAGVAAVVSDLVADLLRGRGRTGGAGGVGTTITFTGVLGALAGRGGNGGVGTGCRPPLLERAFAPAGGCFRGSLLLDRAFGGPSGGLRNSGMIAGPLLFSGCIDAGRFVSILVASGAWVGSFGADAALLFITYVLDIVGLSLPLTPFLIP